MRVVIYYPPSPGCENSARILVSAILESVRQKQGKVILVCAKHDMPAHLTQKLLPADFEADCVFFYERVLDHPALMRARHKILIPNPEWLDALSRSRAGACTHVWHKSHDSLERLAQELPRARHAYLGFTSIDPGLQVSSYESFIHFRGKSWTRRNTNSILAHWKARPSLPSLYVHWFENKTDGLEYPGWLSDGNVHVRIGWLERQEYLTIASQHGMHLCVSEAEGFGHYINEARAMGSLVITTDAPPMNELVDADSGILVRPSRSLPMELGNRYLVSAEDLAPAIDFALSLTPKARRERGMAARQRFLDEGRAFGQRARDLFAALQEAARLW